MENKERDFFITLHSFMHKIGLNRTECLVYALIYSYTRGEYGLYFGTQKRAGELSGISPRTVARVYKRLYELGYIVKDEINGHRGVRCVLGEDGKPLAVHRKETPRKRVRENAHSPDPTSQPDATQNHRKSLVFEYLEFGNMGLVLLTAKQHSALLGLVGKEVLDIYFKRMETMLQNSSLNYVPSPHSHYRTLKKWIESDFSL